MKQHYSKFGVLGIYFGIVVAFLSYEVFNKIDPTYPPLVMRGWLDEKIPIISIFVIPYLSFHLLAAFIVPYLSLKFGSYKAFLVNGFAIIFGHLALVYSKNLSNNIAKYKMNLLYFGLSFILILISLINLVV